MRDKNAPVGLPAIALRLRGAPRRTVLVIAVLACTALLVGVGLLLT
ncbi:hypothetical protein ACIP2X_10460 [Streptomyces sp. NPDC089424]